MEQLDHTATHKGSKIGSELSNTCIITMIKLIGKHYKHNTYIENYISWVHRDLIFFLKNVNSYFTNCLLYYCLPSVILCILDSYWVLNVNKHSLQKDGMQDVVIIHIRIIEILLPVLKYSNDFLKWVPFQSLSSFPYLTVFFSKLISFLSGRKHA